MESLLDCATNVVRAQIDLLVADATRLRVPRQLGERQRIANAPFHPLPELFLQIAGTTEFTFPEERIVLAPGELCIVPRLLPHGERVRSGPDRFGNLVLMLDPSVSVHRAAESPIQRNRPYVAEAVRLTEIDPARLAADLDRIVAQVRSAPEAAHYRMLALLSDLLVLFRDARRVEPSGHPLGSRARTQVLLNLSDPRLSVSRLAAWLGCSADYLSHLFHRETNERLSRFISRHRVSRAEGLLTESTLTISEVAWASGFDDPAYFSRVFRAHAGDSPRAYRKSGGRTG